MNTFIKNTILSIFFLSTSVFFAQEKNDTVSKEIPKAQSFVTQHEIVNGGRKISYIATAKETYLKNKEGDEVASIWSVAYTENNSSQKSQKPVTFLFNGGPGSASVWLHFGMFGPELVKVSSDASEDDGAAPYRFTKNLHGLLDLTDLVFIDPMGTGYSHAIGKGDPKNYWGLNEDAQLIAQFMRQWTTDNNRWNAPKYIAGESFGTTRAVAVTKILEGGGQNMALNGLVLISQALDYAGSTSTAGNITSFLTYFPAMAATAWYHKKAGTGKQLEDFIQEAREFTYNTYAPALYKGNLLNEKEKNSIAQKMSEFIGLPKDYILKSDLRILIPRFQKQLLINEGLTIGRLDGRYMGNEGDKVSETPRLGDASSYQVDAAYTALLNSYYANVLKVKMDRPYLTSNAEISKNWKWRTAPQGVYWEPNPVNVADQLGESMRRNTDLKVYVASGYYDLICPFFDTEYTFSRHHIVKERVQLSYFEAGHMMYLHQPDFIKLSNELRAFYTTD